jgi:hypothetical protein
VDLGSSSDVADRALDQDRRIDALEGFDGLFRLANVLLERQRREVEDDGVKARFGDIQGVRQRMGVVRVEEDWIVLFLSQAPHQSGFLSHAEKFPLSLRGADSDRDFEVPRGGHDRLQQNQVLYVEVADRHSVLPTLLQSFSQTLHAARSF